MSLKINNAYQIKSSQLPDIIKDLYEIKEKLFNITVKELQKEGFKSEEEVSDFFSKDFTGDWSWMKCSVMVYFYKGKTIIQFFNSLQSLDLTKDLVTKYDMKDYSYQNNSDPEKVRNWKERGEFWKDLSNDFGDKFSDKGLQYKLISNDDIFQLRLKARIAYFFPEKPKFSFKAVLRDFFSNLYNSYGK